MPCRGIDFLVSQDIIKPIQIQEKTKQCRLKHLDHHNYCITEVPKNTDI